MLRDLANFNPWWEGNSNLLPSNFRLRKSFEQQKHCLSNSDISIFQGIFKAGKTTFLLFLINELLTKLYIQPNRILFLDCQKTTLNLENVSSFIEKNSPYKTFVFLDNIDSEKSIDTLQKIINKHESLIKICATSTQNIELERVKEKVSHSEIFPLSFKENIEIQNPELTEKLFTFEELESMAKLYNFDKLFEEYLLFGGLIEISKKQGFSEKKACLENLLTQFLKTDEESIYKQLAIKNSQLLNLSNLGSEIGISRYKAEKMLFEIEKYKMISLLPSLEVNINKSLVKSYKIFFHDLGIRNALLKSFNALSERVDNHALYQNFIALEVYYGLKNSEMYFFRTTNQTEINFVITTEDKFIPIQVQISGNQKNIPKIFTSFYRKSKNKISKMFVITKNYLGKDNLGKTDIFFIPAPLFSLFDWNR